EERAFDGLFTRTSFAGGREVQGLQIGTSERAGRRIHYWRIDDIRDCAVRGNSHNAPASVAAIPQIPPGIDSRSVRKPSFETLMEDCAVADAALAQIERRSIEPV